jgi:hypothetical protein
MPSLFVQSRLSVRVREAHYFESSNCFLNDSNEPVIRQLGPVKWGLKSGKTIQFLSPADVPLREDSKLAGSAPGQTIVSIAGSTVCRDSLRFEDTRSASCLAIGASLSGLVGGIAFLSYSSSQTPMDVRR